MIAATTTYAVVSLSKLSQLDNPDPRLSNLSDHLHDHSSIDMSDKQNRYTKPERNAERISVAKAKALKHKTFKCTTPYL